LSITRLKHIATAAHAASPLNDTLAEFLTDALKRPVSKAKARKLIVAGAVFVQKRRVTIPSYRVSAGAAIEANVDLEKLFGDSPSRDVRFELTPDRILFEDEDLIIIDKPPGLPTHPTIDANRSSLVTAVAQFLGTRDGLADPYLGIHHRLDRDTSGVVLLAKSRRVNPALADSFANHRAIKTYQAITVSRPGGKASWTIRNYLGKTTARSRRSRYGAVRSGGEFAETSFRVISRHSHGTWIEAVPKTGRTHQIRVHLSEFGLPILGDDLYGGDPAKIAPRAGRLMLHAVQLVLPHPLDGRVLSIKSPLPADFRECLRQMEN
jgi:23S rRNA pseudouridine1911/1915/1917 synthase